MGVRDVKVTEDGVGAVGDSGVTGIKGEYVEEFIELLVGAAFAGAGVVAALFADTGRVR